MSDTCTLDQQGYTWGMVQKPDTNTDQSTDVDQDVQEASRSTSDFIQNVAPVQAQKKKSRNYRIVLIILFVVLMLVALGFGLKSILKKAPQEKAPTQQSSQPHEDDEEKSRKGLKKYSSKSMKLSFEYPEAWQVSDDEPDKITVESPRTMLVNATGQEIETKVIISIVPSADETDFPEDQATGVRPSEKFAYEAPAVDQRQETYLSFMNLTGASEGLNAAYITGDASYTKGDPIKKADFEKVAPIIWVEFHDSTGQQVTIPVDTWGTNEMLKEAFEVLKSFTLK